MLPVSEARPPTADLQCPARAFGVLVLHSFQRHWRVKQMGWVAVGLLALVVTWVALVTMRGAWGLENRRVGRGLPTYRQYAEQQLTPNRYDPRRYDPVARPYGLAPVAAYEVPSPFNPVKDGVQSLVLSVPHVVVRAPVLAREWAFVNFTRWAMMVGFVGFVLPLFTLSYASAAFGTERESRSLIWLMTRPLPRSAIYLAKFLGTLPWCVLFGLGGFAAMCLAGGEHGRAAFALYWPSAVTGTVAFAALFHLVGAVFRRPVVVGLVYVFFYEALVAALPGSLKLLSLSYYVRSLMYNAAGAAGYPTELMDMVSSVPDPNAWAFLLVVTVGLTALGMWLFTRSEYRDDI
ncbi:MAG TPA: ABC transporter permease [Gemmata sp.]|nr:ABC transporter permease [Gemmata sp.]